MIRPNADLTRFFLLASTTGIFKERLRLLIVFLADLKPALRLFFGGADVQAENRPNVRY